MDHGEPVTRGYVILGCARDCKRLCEAARATCKRLCAAACAAPQRRSQYQLRRVRRAPWWRSQ
eukprot:scaffold178243_cov31-Tisochrysis_lutea.AAC.1